MEGTVRRGTKLGAGARIAVWYSGIHISEDRTPNVFWSLSTTADASGKFSLDRVATGNFGIGRALDNDKFSESNVDTVAISTKPGETYTVQIGGVGRPIVGHIDIPPDLAAKGFDYYEGSMVPAVQPDYWSPPAEVQAMTPSDRTAWYKKWFESPEGKKIT